MVLSTVVLVPLTTSTLPAPLTVRSSNLWKRLVSLKRIRRGKFVLEVDVNGFTDMDGLFFYSGRKITQDGQRDLDRIAMTLAEEADEE